ncbi:MAG: Holliday junction branch migration protein RuvA [Parcubacteria group bacterium]|nr:Holliday junction branch migration protein RuvA [Parcubacteria group bacterium]
MISFIEGEVIEKDSRGVVVRAGGLGFRLLTADTTLRKLPQVGETTALWTHLYFRDDRMELYGFLAREELDLFELLISVAGIGPKSALAVLDIGNVEKIKSAIASGDITLLMRVSGIGKKSAERIVVELRSKIATSRIPHETLRADLDAEEALTSLGYSRMQAKEALERVPASASRPEDRVREALKILGRK